MRDLNLTSIYNEFIYKIANNSIKLVNLEIKVEIRRYSYRVYLEYFITWLYNILFYYIIIILFNIILIIIYIFIYIIKS